MQVAETPEQSQQSPNVLEQYWEALLSKPVYLYGALFLVCAGAFAMYRPFEQRVGGDPAVYDYIAQCILRGQVPYRDVVDIKAPGSYYITAAAMWLGKWVGMRDVLADRLAHGIMLGLLVVTVAKVAREYLGNAVAGIIAGVFMLMSSAFMYWMALGGQPKLSMALFGMLALLIVKRDRPFWAGVFSMLSCLCWQPGLLFAGSALLAMSGYLTRWRDMRIAKLVVGAALPLAIALVYLGHVGALKHFWAYTIQYNYSVFAPSAAKPPSATLMHFLKVSRRVLGPLIFVFVTAAAGWGIYVFQRVIARRPSSSFVPAESLNDAIAIAPLVYLMFCFINFQGGPDLILFFPFVGIFAAYSLVEILRMLASNTKRHPHQAVVRLIPAAVAVLMLAVAFEQGLIAWRSGKGFFKSQDLGVQAIGELLDPGDKIYVHGVVEILVLLDRPNMNPYVFMDWGMDEFITRKWYGGSFQKILDEMESQSPKIVALSRLGEVNRLGRVEHADELEAWVSQRYEKASIGGYDLFERRPELFARSADEPRLIRRSIDWFHDSASCTRKR